jgi:hypothetical protein
MVIVNWRRSVSYRYNDQVIVRRISITMPRTCYATLVPLSRLRQTTIVIISFELTKPGY